MKLWSWNVNGIRAALKKGFLEVLDKEDPDILFVQETKALPEQLEDNVLKHGRYHSYWFSAERKGYSGVALFTKEEPLSIEKGTGVPEFDAEGRVICAEYPDFFIYGIYFPNGGMGEHRLEYKYKFYDHMLDEFEQKRAIKPVIITGDFNVAHEEIDLARPKENQKTSGFLPEERAWFTSLMEHGYVDTFRHFHPDATDEYSWWSMRLKARPRNVGWRIDYFVVSEEFMDHVKDAGIRQDIMGSDHCPVTLTL